MLHLERLRYAAGEPLAVMRNWLPADLGPVLTVEGWRTRGLYELLRAPGCTCGRHPADRRPRGRPRRGQAARERKGAPLLTMERITYDGSGRAVEFGSHVYNAQTYFIEMTVVER